jgi:CheY-like chemotaxis protein
MTDLVQLHSGVDGDTWPSEWVLGLRGRAPLVLIVEPDEDSRALMRLLFENGGLTVAECSEGERVLDEIARLRPDLVILEERLSCVDGRTVCRRLRNAAENIRHTPVIIISSSSEPSSARLAFEAGCSLCFIKPFDIEDLMDAASELVVRAHDLR